MIVLWLCYVYVSSEGKAAVFFFEKPWALSAWPVWHLRASLWNRFQHLGLQQARHVNDRDLTIDQNSCIDSGTSQVYAIYLRWKHSKTHSLSHSTRTCMLMKSDQQESWHLYFGFQLLGCLWFLHFLTMRILSLAPKTFSFARPIKPLRDHRRHGNRIPLS